jgi:hypothetical protein
MREASTIDAVEQLLAEGRIRQYGCRQLTIYLTRKHGHCSRRDDDLIAFQTCDDCGAIPRITGMKKKRRDNYRVLGPTWLWCLDSYNKPLRFGIETYGCVDAYARKII